MSRYPTPFVGALGSEKLLIPQNDYRGLLDRLEKAKIRYVVLHGWESLLGGSISDLDLMVCEEDLARTECLLNLNYRILNVFRYEAASFAFVLSPPLGEGDSILVADISTDYRSGGLIFFDAESFLQSRERWRGYWVAAPKQELEYLLVKKLYEKSEIPDEQKIRIEQLAQVLGVRLVDASLAKLFGSDWGKQVNEWIRQQNWDRVEAHIPRLRKCIQREVLKRDLLNPFRFWRDEMCRMWTRLHDPTGMSLALAGLQDEDVVATVTCAMKDLPHVFRRVRFLPSPAKKTGTQTFFKHIHCLLHSLWLRVHIRMLVVRSTVCVCRDLRAPEKERPTPSAQLLRWLMPQADLLLNLSDPWARRSRPQQANGKQNRSESDLFGQAPAADDFRQIVETIRESIEEYVLGRYRARRDLRFSR